MTWKLYPVTEFANHKNRWQHFNLGGTRSPLMDVSFILPALRIFGNGEEIFACYEKNNRAVAMTILSRKGLGSWETFQPSQAPLGAWMHNEHTEWGELLPELFKKLPGFPLLLGITQQDPDLIPRPQGIVDVETLDHIQTARVYIEGSFDNYWNARSKKLQQNMRRQRSNLAKAGVTTRLQVTTAPEDVGQAIADYGRLESGGWKGRAGTAVHVENNQGQFYRTVLEDFCRRGAGRIYRYWYNDRIAAMNICIEGNESLISLKIAYDESLSKGTSPAMLMRQAVFKELFDDARFKKIEFYGKGQTIWTDQARTLYHVNKHRFIFLPFLRSLMPTFQAVQSR